MKKRWLLILLSALLSFGLLIGCSSGESTPTDTNPDQQMQVPAGNELPAPSQPDTSNEGNVNDGGSSDAGNPAESSK